MSRHGPANIPASIRARLLNISRPTGEDFNLTLVRYAVERFLYRLSQSRYAANFILKGAMLFTVWTLKPHRPTQDLDLLGIGDLSDENLHAILNDIISTKVTEDGLEFLGDSITIAEIREGQAYQGKRVKLASRIGKTRIRLQIDIGLGDVVVPKPKTIDYPTLLDLPAPRIRAYSRETVVAEKLEAMISLGAINSRMKDFYDLWFMSQRFSFGGITLSKAMIATFKRRRTELPKQTPSVLTGEFIQDAQKQRQWQTFVQRAELSDSALEFAEVIEQLSRFLSPPLQATANNKKFTLCWEPGGPWSKPDK